MTNTYCKSEQTLAGYPVKNLRIIPIHYKDRFRPVYRICGLVFYADPEKGNIRSWKAEQWLINGKHPNNPDLELSTQIKIKPIEPTLFEKS